MDFSGPKVLGPQGRGHSRKNGHFKFLIFLKS
jgi:hypothetical protein